MKDKFNNLKAGLAKSGMSKTKKFFWFFFTFIALFSWTRYSYIHTLVHEVGHAYGAILVLNSPLGIEIFEDGGGVTHIQRNSPMIFDGSDTAGAFTFFFLLGLLMFKWYKKWGYLAGVLFIIGGFTNLSFNLSDWALSDRRADLNQISILDILLWAPYHIGVWYLFPWLLRRYMNYKPKIEAKPVPISKPIPKPAVRLSPRVMPLVKSTPKPVPRPASELRAPIPSKAAQYYRALSKPRPRPRIEN